jgi:hypothetical protein
MLVEVIDKYRVSNMRVGKISEVVRLDTRLQSQ